jgi:hypothetical protein
MIKLEVNTTELLDGLDHIISGIQELKQQSVIDSISQAVFSITSERFVLDLDSYARANPKRMHHVYEWGQIGQSQGRLFVLERASIADGSLLINTNFLKSKLPVPLNEELLIPGPTGKVVTKRSIFANKAEVMENGNPVSFTAEKVLAFAGTNGLAFIKPGTTVNILNPGGSLVKNAFAEYMLQWYTDNGNMVMDASGIYDSIAETVARVLSTSGAGASEVSSAVKSLIVSSGLDKEIIQ